MFCSEKNNYQELWQEWAVVSVHLGRGHPQYDRKTSDAMPTIC